jgi:hypothetical protein
MILAFLAFFIAPKQGAGTSAGTRAGPGLTGVGADASILLVSVLRCQESREVFVEPGP